VRRNPRRGSAKARICFQKERPLRGRQRTEPGLAHSASERQIVADRARAGSWRFLGKQVGPLGLKVVWLPAQSMTPASEEPQQRSKEARQGRASPRPPLEPTCRQSIGRGGWPLLLDSGGNPRTRPRGHHHSSHRCCSGIGGAGIRSGLARRRSTSASSQVRNLPVIEPGLPGDLLERSRLPGPAAGAVVELIRAVTHTGNAA